MAYTVKSSERLRPSAADTETKALLYLMNFRDDSDEIFFFVVDFFNDLTGIVQNHLEALYLRAFLVPFWARENILKTRISILGHFLSFFNTKKCKLCEKTSKKYQKIVC